MSIFILDSYNSAYKLFIYSESFAWLYAPAAESFFFYGASFVGTVGYLFKPPIDYFYAATLLVAVVVYTFGWVYFNWVPGFTPPPKI